jgi:hypothetical protein
VVTVYTKRQVLGGIGAGAALASIGVAKPALAMSYDEADQLFQALSAMTWQGVYLSAPAKAEGYVARPCKIAVKDCRFIFDSKYRMTGEAKLCVSNKRSTMNGGYKSWAKFSGYGVYQDGVPPGIVIEIMETEIRSFSPWSEDMLPVSEENKTYFSQILVPFTHCVGELYLAKDTNQGGNLVLESRRSMEIVSNGMSSDWLLGQNESYFSDQT